MTVFWAKTMLVTCHVASPVTFPCELAPLLGPFFILHRDAMLLSIWDEDKGHPLGGQCHEAGGGLCGEGVLCEHFLAV